jgi:hypothetical protein
MHVRIKREYDFEVTNDILTLKMDNPLGIKQRFNPTRAVTLTYIISLAVIASLAIFVYFSVDKIILEQSAYAKPISVSGQQHDVENNQKRDELRDIQQIILMIITLSVLINGLLIVQTLLKKPIQNPKNPQQEANHDYLTNLYSTSVLFMYLLNNPLP